MVDPRDAVGARAVHRHAIVGFLGGDFWNVPVETKLGEVRFRVGKRHMRLVDDKSLLLKARTIE